MSYASIVQTLPEDLQLPLIELANTVERNVRSEAVVRREDVSELRWAVSELAQAQLRGEQRLDRLEQAVTELAEAQKRTEQRMNELVEAQKRTEVILQQLLRFQERAEPRLDMLVGEMLERRYRARAFAYFGNVLKAVRVVDVQEFEAELGEHLTQQEIEDLALADLVLVGKPVKQSGLPQAWLVVEVSAMIDRGDVERAIRRTMWLRRLRNPVVPVVAGEQITDGAEQLAEKHRIFVVQDGSKRYWDEALAQALTA